MKLKSLRTVAIALVAAGALVLTSCAGGAGGDDATSVPGSSTAVIKANGSEPQNPLIPTNTIESGGSRILDVIFAGLVYFDASGAAHNDVAESITTDDSITYTIKIKSGLEFTNGESVTSASFIDAWNYGALLSNAQNTAFFFEKIEGFSWDKDSELTGLKAIDDTTFTVTLVSAQADFPVTLGHWAFYPLPESAYADMDAFGANPIGNGPYKLASATAWKHNESISLVVNEDYDGARKAANGGIDFVFHASQDAAYADLLSDNVDVIDFIPPSALANFQADLGDRAVNQPSAVFNNFIIPEKLDHFGGEEGKLRRAAISMAINREEITRVIYEGTRTPASDFTSPVVAGWTDDIKGADVLEFNPEEAVKLWAKADAISPWSGSLQIAHNADGGHQGWVDAASNSIKNTLGIDASGVPVATFAEFRTQIVNATITTAFRSGAKAQYPAQSNFLGAYYGSNGGSNDGNYSNPEFDALLAKGLSESDIDKANEAFREAQEILFVDLPSIPLWYSNVTGGYSTKVENVQFGWNSIPLYYAITKE